MSLYSINLRSDNPALLVEFNLQPGSHARIGAALDAEITLPLAGLADYAGIIGRSPDGRVFVSDPDGSNRRFVELPAALSLPPYQFVIFHPQDATEHLPPVPAYPAPPPPRAKVSRRIIPTAITGTTLIGLAALILISQSNKPAMVSTPPKAAEPAPTASTQPQPPPKEAPKPAPEIVEATAPATPEPKPEAKSEPPPAKLDLEALAQRIAPAVFRLEVKDSKGVLAATGTAFAISSDGLAVTNFHVVEDGSTFTARTTQGAEFTVSGVTATDPDADLALIAIKGTGIAFLELGESDPVKIGAPVAVYGCPRGLSGTLSDGILSARRNDPEIAGTSAANGGRLLQISAPISSGSSGSPVIDQTGKVIGVAVAVLPGPTSQNLNFVIPVEAVKKLRKDSLEGLAKGFSPASRAIPAEPQKQDVPENTPEAQFLADREFKKLYQFFREADWIEMQKIARGLVVKYPEAPSAHLFLATALSGLKLHEGAELEAKRGLALEAENALLWFTLGSAQLDQFHHAEARASLRKSAAIAPELSPTWQRLTASYLIGGDYIEAVSPMDQLRKLDRPEFDRLIGVLRAIRFQPPELQALLDHFDGMTDRPTQTNEAPATPESMAAALVSSFLRHGTGQDVRAELADYAPTVDPYFDQGRQSTAYILKDITTYRTQWPRRSLQLIRIESARMANASTLDASFRLNFTATDGRRNRSGTLIQAIRFSSINGRWLVSGIKTTQRVKE